MKVLIQEFIETEKNGAKDIRVIVIDGEVVASMERTSKGDFRSNLSLDGQGRKVVLSAYDKDICIRAARACGLEVAGVDLIKDQQGTSYVVEVNGNYGYIVETVTGIDISTPLIEYCERNYKGGNENSQQTNQSFFSKSMDYLRTHQTIAPMPESVAKQIGKSKESKKRNPPITKETITLDTFSNKYDYTTEEIIEAFRLSEGLFDN